MATEAAAPAAAATPAKPKRGYLLPGTIALVVLGGLAAVFGVVGLQTHYPRTLAGPEEATLISQALQARARHGEAVPPTVRCPAVEPVRRGLVFDCTLVRPGGRAQTIRVTETNARGSTSYEVEPR